MAERLNRADVFRVSGLHPEFDGEEENDTRRLLFVSDEEFRAYDSNLIYASSLCLVRLSDSRRERARRRQSCQYPTLGTLSHPASSLDKLLS